MSERQLMAGLSQQKRRNRVRRSHCILILLTTQKKLPAVRITVDTWIRTVFLWRWGKKAARGRNYICLCGRSLVWFHWPQATQEFNSIFTEKKENFYCSSIEHWKLYFHLFYIRWGKLFYSVFLFLLATKAAGGALWYFLMTTSTLVLLFSSKANTHTHSKREKWKWREWGKSFRILEGMKRTHKTFKWSALAEWMRVSFTVNKH